MNIWLKFPFHFLPHGRFWYMRGKRIYPGKYAMIYRNLINSPTWKLFQSQKVVSSQFIFIDLGNEDNNGCKRMTTKSSKTYLSSSFSAVPQICLLLRDGKFRYVFNSTREKADKRTQGVWTLNDVPSAMHNVMFVSLIYHFKCLQVAIPTFLSFCQKA